MLVSKAHFSDFSKDGNGGVFEITSASLKVDSCTFNNNQVRYNGGCIYLVTGTLEMTKCSFYSCYSYENRDEISGNAAFINKNKANVTYVSTYLCGPSEKKCGDSSIRTIACENYVRFINATQNYGVIGSSMYALDEAKTQTSVSYVQDINGKDYITLQSVTNYYEVSKGNFINGYDHKYVFWETKNNILKIIDSVIWNFGGKPITNGYEILLENCVSDSTSIMATNVQLLSTYALKFPLLFQSCIKSKQQRCRCYIYQQFIFNLLLSS